MSRSLYVWSSVRPPRSTSRAQGNCSAFRLSSYRIASVVLCSLCRIITRSAESSRGTGVLDQCGHAKVLCDIIVKFALSRSDRYWLLQTGGYIGTGIQRHSIKVSRVISLHNTLPKVVPCSWCTRYSTLEG